MCFISRMMNMNTVKYLILFTFVLLFLTYFSKLEETKKFNSLQKYHLNLNQSRMNLRERVLEETKKFASLETEEDDPALIEFIKKLIKPPSTKPYNLILSNIKNGDYSQEGQSLYIDKILNGRTEGFFIGKYFKYVFEKSTFSWFFGWFQGLYLSLTKLY